MKHDIVLLILRKLFEQEWFYLLFRFIDPINDITKLRINIIKKYKLSSLVIINKIVVVYYKQNL